MANSLFRKVHVSFWNDPYVFEELKTPNEKLFYNYLLSNDKTTGVGIYEITLKYISIYTAIPFDECSEILKKLIDDKKVKYDENNKEIFILNAMKHNLPNFNNENINIWIKKELRSLKTKEFIAEWFDIVQKKLNVKLPFSYEDIISGSFEKERKKRARKEEKIQIKKDKIKYGKYVLLKDEEYKKLVETFGEKKTAEIIEFFNLKIASKGEWNWRRDHKSDYSTILYWHRNGWITLKDEKGGMFG